jgi:hypothetical protein
MFNGRLTLASGEGFEAHLAPAANKFVETLRSSSTPLKALDGQFSLTEGESRKDLDSTVRGLLGGITELLAVNVSNLDTLLTENFRAKLKKLDLTITNASEFPDAHPYPNLTSFCFKMLGCDATTNLGDHLIDFLSHCPQLEVVYFSYDDIKFTPNSKTVSLPSLRSFTHESLSETMPMGLFNRLTVPPTCEATLMVTVSGLMQEAEKSQLSEPVLGSERLNNIRRGSIGAPFWHTDHHSITLKPMSRFRSRPNLRVPTSHLIFNGRILLEAEQWYQAGLVANVVKLLNGGSSTMLQGRDQSSGSTEGLEAIVSETFGDITELRAYLVRDVDVLLLQGLWEKLKKLDLHVQPSGFPIAHPHYPPTHEIPSGTDRPQAHIRSGRQSARAPPGLSTVGSRLPQVW